ncbi:MAG: class I SAM-dependent methyltransferase [Leptospira sp.]|nr:class I SAM-dependent methyltransferase [Leptospira sp.]
MKLYTELAEYYFDLEKGGRRFDEEIYFLDDIFKKHKIKSIIDLGCGTGEHVKALQSRGYEVVGVDSSDKMIGEAKKRFPHCRFETGFMQGYQATHNYDSIVSLFGSFNYLISDEEVKSCLKLLQQNLKPAGLAILEVWNASPIRRIKRKPISNVTAVKSGTLNIRRNRGFRLTRSDAATVVEVNYVYNLDKREVKDKHIMRVFFLNEIKSRLEDHKFEILNIYGNYNMDKFKESGGRILIVAKKKG